MGGFVSRSASVGSGLLIVAGVVATTAIAGDQTAEERLFDPPRATQDLDRVDGPHPAEAWRCHAYADLMVRETQTDSRGFGRSYFVHPGPDVARPACHAAPSARDSRMDTQNRALIGRKGDYAVFETTDAPGPVPLEVRYPPDSRTIYSDRKNDAAPPDAHDGIAAVAVEEGALRLRYLRGYDAGRSLLKNAAACRRKAMQQRRFARIVAAQPPPTARAEPPRGPPEQPRTAPAPSSTTSTCA